MSKKDRDFWMELHKLPETSEKDKARLETYLWNDTTPEERAVENERRVWLSKLLGTEQSPIQYRSSIQAMGEVGDTLWERIASKTMSLSVASKLSIKARKRATIRKTALEIALSEVIQDYDALPNIAYVNGFATRRRNPGSVPIVPPEPPKPEATDSSRSLFESVRQIVMPIVVSKIPGTDATTAEMLYRDFERDLKILLEELQLRVNRAAKTVKANSSVILHSVSWSRTQEACAILAIALPQRGGPVDMKLAKAQKWRLARAYHPDSNGGVENETTRSKLKAVLDAFDYLEKYNTILGKGEANNG